MPTTTTTSLPPPPLFKILTAASPPSVTTLVSPSSGSSTSNGGGSSSYSYNPSLLIIAAIIVFVILASAAIHLLLRLLSRPRRYLPPLIHPRNSSSSTASIFATSSFRQHAVTALKEDEEKEKKEREAAIESLPVFTLEKAISTTLKSSADCAVCLSRFRFDDELRLLPACRHAFHQSCVDAWLRATPSCPLCRASIYLPPAPPPPPEQQQQQQREREIADLDGERSGSFRVEIGSVSRRRSNAGGEQQPANNGRSYSIGSAYEFLVEEEVEAVVARALRRPVSKEQKQSEGNISNAREEQQKQQQQASEQPVSNLDELAGGIGGSGRSGGGSWLRDYVDRLASSASSSFSSIRFSSRRYETSTIAAAIAGDVWDLESNNQTTANSDDSGGFSAAFYRWFMGVPP